jgi:hypothetical protein
MCGYHAASSVLRRVFGRKLAPELETSVPPRVGS